jgi:hypothetical protein
MTTTKTRRLDRTLLLLALDRLDEIEQRLATVIDILQEQALLKERHDKEETGSKEDTREAHGDRPVTVPL